MPKTIRIAKTAIDDAISTFKQLPAKAPADYSLREAIGQILPAINDLIKKGYNLDEISALLTQKDIAISSTTLKQYLRDLGKFKPKQSRSKPPAVTLNPVPNAVDTGVSPEISVPKPEKNSTVKDSVVAKPASTEQPYKSPPKPGSEQFK
jgi:hypothetical protein